jgi:hypothetical protein
MKMIGMIEDKGMDSCQKEMLDAKRKEYEAIHNIELDNNGPGNEGSDDVSDFPANAMLCKKCHTEAVISMDGCMTCLNCGDSKCS